MKSGLDLISQIMTGRRQILQYRTDICSLKPSTFGDNMQSTMENHILGVWREIKTVRNHPNNRRPTNFARLHIINS
jgi:hypothetical protein